ncbi:MAG: lysophospholipid acyltransferase family protein [Pseudomonadales bacterium]
MESIFLAKFIFGNSVRKTATQSSVASRLLWLLDLLFIGSIFALLRLLPVDTASALGNRFGRWLGPKFEKKSSIVKTNLSQALPDKSAAQIDQLTAQVWGNAGAVFAEYAHLEKICNTEASQRLEIVNLGDIETFRDPASPMVIATAHLANWELVAASAVKMGAPFAALFSPPANPWFAKLLAKHRQALGCELLPRDASMRALIRALEQGKSIGMVMDRRADSGKPVPFFGRDMSTTLLPARLALRYDCDLVPVRVERLQDAHFRVTFYPPVKSGDPQADADTQAVQMARQVNSQFEDWIRARPHDWLCTKRLWPKQKVPVTPTTAPVLGAH